MQRLPIFRDLCLKTCNKIAGRKCQIGLKGGTGMRLMLQVSQSNTERCFDDLFDPSFLHDFTDLLKKTKPKALLHSLTHPLHYSFPHLTFISSKLITVG